MLFLMPFPIAVMVLLAAVEIAVLARDAAAETAPSTVFVVPLIALDTALAAEEIAGFSSGAGMLKIWLTPGPL